MSAARSLDDVRQAVLDRVERGERATKLGIFGAALVEALMLALALALIDWKDPLQRLVFILFVLSYSIVVLGLVALGGHVTRTVGRLLDTVDAVQGGSPR